MAKNFPVLLLHSVLHSVLHGVLMVGALLPSSPLATPSFPTHPFAQITSDLQTDQLDAQLISYGHGIPRFRRGGGTR
jgi:hypothetical protein